MSILTLRDTKLLRVPFAACFAYAAACADDVRLCPPACAAGPPARQTLPAGGGQQHRQAPWQPLLRSAGSWDLRSPGQGMETSMQRMGAASLGAWQVSLAALHSFMPLLALKAV